MIRNFSWVIPRRLSGAAMPGEGWDLDGTGSVDRRLLTDLAELREMGVRRLVSLTDLAQGFGPACRETGLEWTYFAIPDFGIPEVTTEFAGLVASLTGEVAAGRGVCVHCYAGIGRTGLVLSCVVGRYLSLDGPEAIRRVRETRAALETREQELFVQRFLRSAG